MATDSRLRSLRNVARMGREITPAQEAAKHTHLDLNDDYWMSAVAFGTGECYRKSSRETQTLLGELSYLDGLKALDARARFDRRKKEEPAWS